MASSNGREWFQSSLDNSQLRRDMKEAENLIKGIGNTAVSESNRMNSAFSSVKNTAAGFLTAAAALDFGKNVVKITGEFQQLSIAMETMLGNKGKADALMSQMVDTAAKTPFDLKGIANGAKMLLAYGVEAEKVNGTLVRLGDIASGLSIPLGDLVYLYGTTMAQGRMYTQDLNQFTGRGIPMIQELAKQFGVAESSVKSLVEEGKVGFPEVQKVIESLTDKGGKFANLMEKQSKSITGQISNIQDGIEMAMKDIGESQSGIINTTLQITSSLVDNYEKLGRVIGSLVATYGAYKAAMIAVAAVENYKRTSVITSTAYNALLMTEVTTTQRLTVAKWLQVKAQTALNAAMKVNPYIMAATAIVGLVGIMWALRDSTTAAEKAQKTFNERQEEAKRKADEQKSKLEELIRVLRDEYASQSQRIEAMKALEKEYPKIFQKYIDEKGHIADLIGLWREYNEAAGLKALQDDKGRAQEIREQIAKLEAEKKRGTTIPGESDMAFNIRIDSKIDKLKEDLKLINKEISKQSELQWEANTPTDVQKQLILDRIEALKEENKQLEGIISKGKEDVLSYDPTAKSKQQANIEQIKQLQEEYEKLGETKHKEAVRNKAYWEKEKKDAENALDSMTEADKGTKEWINQARKRAEAIEKLSQWDYSDKNDSAAEKARKEAQKISDAQLDQINSTNKNGFDLRQAVIDNDLALLETEKDSADKRIRQIELNYEKEKLAIEKYEQELIEARQAAERKAWEAAGSKGVFKATTLTGSQLSTDNQSDISNKRKANNERKKAEERDLLQSLLDQYQDYGTKRKAIETKYSEDVAALNRMRTEANKKEIDAAIAEAGRLKKIDLSNLDFDEFKKTEDWQALFSNLDKKALSTLENLWESLNKVKDANKEAWTPEQLREFEEAVERLYDTVRDRNPFKAIGDNFKTLLDNIGKSDKASKDKVAASANDISQATNKLQGDLEKVAGGIGEIFGDEAGYAAEQITELTGALAGFGQGAAKLLNGDIVGGVADIVSSVGKIFSMGRKTKEMNEAARKEIQEYYDTAIKGEREYQALLRERARAAEQSDREMLASYEKMITELSKQSGDIQKEYDKIWSALMGEEYVSGQGYRHGTWFRKAKTWDEMSSLNGLSYDDIEKLYTEGKLKDNAKELFEELRRLKEEGIDVNEMMKEQQEALNEYISGMTFDSLRDSIKDAFSDGKYDIQDAANFTKNAFKTAMLQALESKVLNKALEPFLDSFTKDAMDGSLFEKMDYYEKWIAQIGEDGNKFMESLMSIPGLKDVFSDSSSYNSLSGAYSKSSQESIGLLAGQTGAARISLDKTAFNTDAIRQSMQAIYDIQNRGLDKMEAIRALTSEIRDINRGMAATNQKVADNTAGINSISESLKQVATHGVTLK